MIRKLTFMLFVAISCSVPWQSAFARHRVILPPANVGVQVPAHVETQVLTHPGTYLAAHSDAYVPVVTPREPYYNDYVYPFYPSGPYYYVWSRNGHHHHGGRVDIYYRAGGY